MSEPAVATGMATGDPTHDRRRWITLAVLLLGQFMGLLDVFIVNVAMPAIGHTLHASGASLQLVVGGYTIAYAMLLITGARLGDLYGRRRMYLVGAVVFTAASLVCGFAPTIYVLIVFRFIQGAGAAVMVPQIISVIQVQFTGRARATALSVYAVVLSTGQVIGVLLGGVLVSANLLGASWRPVFLINVPLGLCLTPLVPRYVPADTPRAIRRLDITGLAIAVSSVFLIVLPLILGHEGHWPAWTFLSIAVGLLLAVFFVLAERRVAARHGDPLLILDVLRSPGIASGITTLFCMTMTYGGLLFIFTLHLQSGLGNSALHTGLTYLPFSAATGLAAYYWRKLPDRIQHMVSPIGMTMCAVGYFGIAVAMHGASGNPLMWAALVVTGAGQGLVLSPVLAQALIRVPPAKAADASGILTTTLQLGQVVGVAVFGTIFLSTAQHSGTSLAAITPQSSASALFTTLTFGLSVLAVVGIVAASVLSRTVLRAKRLTADKEVAGRPDTR
ncbi:MFS transporter [Nocardia terpenica]|uniref:MFS transporter n=1 Tax=Nocardia terpenica TaxID=455432 RepID=UPI001892EAA8|nr:MFS transporter [Nocardia terpenica]MBF6061103.1 MFS transporter [Nocardia terpenica]MBF6105668.1 MFS transporter [Nocardia terpenica]MBF6112862.1 MFS transporter [Nocardia terpenica]MBF6118992.1 MFS transporter [Nocardia terpenica]